MDRWEWGGRETGSHPAAPRRNPTEAREGGVQLLQRHKGLVDDSVMRVELAERHHEDVALALERRPRLDDLCHLRELPRERVFGAEGVRERLVAHGSAEDLRLADRIELEAAVGLGECRVAHVLRHVLCVRARSPGARAKGAPSGSLI